MASRLALFPPLLALSVAACGARTALSIDSAPADGAGGSGGMPPDATTTTTTTTTSTSTGTGGGLPSTCPNLGITGQAISYVSAAALHGARPRLVRASATETMVVFAREAINDPANPPPTIGSVVFEPWGVWPQSLGSVVQVAAFGGEGFAAAPGAAEPSAAVLFFLPTGQFPSDMYLAPTVAPNSYYDPYPDGISWDAWEPAWATALARGAGGHLAAFQVGFPSGTFLRAELVSDNLTLTELGDLACADAPFPADLTEVASGYLLATANGREFGSCNDDDGIPGPATRLHVMRIDPAVGSAPLSAAFEGVDRMAHVALARSFGGAWLAWQESGESAFAPPPIHAVALDDYGGVAGSVFDVTSDGQTSGPLAIADLGGLLAIAWVDNLDPGTPSFQIDLFDAEGAKVASSSYQSPESFLYDPSLSMLASDDGRNLLLSWSALGPAGPAMVEVLRLSCLSGEAPP